MFQVLSIVAMVVAVGALPAQNLFANPGFEAGNSGFSSDYSYSAGSNCCEGQYTVRANPGTFNSAFQMPPPVSPGSSQMLIVNGSTTPGLRVFYQNVAVTAGTTYQLQLWGCTAVAGGPAILQWQIQGALIGSPFTLPTTTQQWVQNTATWVAPSSGTVEIAIRNLNTARFPNDFYVDDVAMHGCVGCWTNYGDGWAGAIGVPGIWLQGAPVLGQQIEIRMVSVRASAELAVLVLGLNRAALPTPFGGTLLVQPVSTEVLAAPAMPTSFAQSLAIPANSAFVGTQLFAQFAHSDPTASAGFAFSRGLELIVGP